MCFCEFQAVTKQEHWEVYWVKAKQIIWLHTLLLKQMETIILSFLFVNRLVQKYGGMDNRPICLLF